VTFWDFLDRQIARMGTRGWMSVGLYVLTWYSLHLIHGNPAFLKLEEIIVQGLVMQGFLGLILAFYFAASKGGVEMADRNQSLVEKQANASPPITDEKDAK
jgi:hypothetical protein